MNRSIQQTEDQARLLSSDRENDFENSDEDISPQDNNAHTKLMTVTASNADNKSSQAPSNGEPEERRKRKKKRQQEDGNDLMHTARDSSDGKTFVIGTSEDIDEISKQLISEDAKVGSIPHPSIDNELTTGYQRMRSNSTRSITNVRSSTVCGMYLACDVSK